jgi:ADP-dependent NAD(P)H-hydrate dehydratase / NAD(P)H-hydrate epimerase
MSLVPPRAADAHKGDAGRLLVIAGSAGKTGAAHLALTGALRGGVGLVTLAARAEVLPFALAGRPEAMSLALPGDGPLGRADLQALLAAIREVDAIVVGPGIPRGPETGELLRALLDRAGKPAVVDADGLNALAEEPALLAGLGVPLLLTPHPGEMARLCGCSTAEVQADRLGIAAARARAWNATVVLKGARTVVAAPDAPTAVIPTGNPGLATGGTGDVLAGLCGALLAAGLSPSVAGRAGAWVHGRAGDLAAARFGERGLVAGDLGDAIGAVWAEWRR